MSDRHIVNNFKNKLDAAITAGSKDIRLSRDEYVKLTVSIGNILLANAELRETNRMLTEKLLEEHLKETSVDGGKF